MNIFFPKADKIMEPTKAFLQKLDLFMQAHVIPKFHPEDIVWWLSLSGGKDSYAMANGLYEWYTVNRLNFQAKAFIIDQWGGPAAHSLKRQLDWIDITVIDGRTQTLANTNYQIGEQAPCRLCADTRRVLTDSIINAADRQAGKINFVARGLHLSDTAVSAVWRFLMSLDPASDIIQKGKARPISKLWHQTYLVKPLNYIREFESQCFAKERGYIPACCGCPACQYPSRRDIAEETLLLKFRGPLWEFDVPGVSELIEKRDGLKLLTQIKEISALGLEEKRNHLPVDFFAFAVEYYRNQLRSDAFKQIMVQLDQTTCLDEIGMARLHGEKVSINCSKIPTPAILFSCDESVAQYRPMITALGPFWGAFALKTTDYMHALHLQEQGFGLTIDERWSHVTLILREYYRRAHVTYQISKKLAVHTVPATSSLVGGT